MAETPAVATQTPAPSAPQANSSPLPAEVALYRDDLTQAAFTPRQLRAVREQFGRSYAEILADEASDERFVVFAWLKLQEAHGPFPVDAMDDVIIRVKVTEDGDPAGRVDPTAGASSST